MKRWLQLTKVISFSLPCFQRPSSLFFLPDHRNYILLIATEWKIPRTSFTAWLSFLASLPHQRHQSTTSKPTPTPLNKTTVFSAATRKRSQQAWSTSVSSSTASSSMPSKKRLPRLLARCDLTCAEWTARTLISTNKTIPSADRLIYITSRLRNTTMSLTASLPLRRKEYKARQNWSNIPLRTCHWRLLSCTNLHR